ncbi:hypothetical protein TrST_g642 [Triparma strigata]|nr:hypothetical protein TrST_g642 [Triparma strigata]
MTKSAVNLKLHKQDVHGIDFRWHHCDQVGCDHKAKHASDLARHKETNHPNPHLPYHLLIQNNICDDEVPSRSPTPPASSPSPEPSTTLSSASEHALQVLSEAVSSGIINV